MLYSLLRTGALLFFKWFLYLKIYGRENIPARGPFIIAANHSSYLDPLLLVVSFPQRLTFIARDKILTSATIGWIARWANTIPVKRHGRDAKALKQALSVLKEGGVLAIFPEGTRSKNRRLKQGKPGVGFLMAQAKVPVIPVYIEGAFDAQPRGIRTFTRRPVTVYAGKPVDLTETRTDSERRERYQRLSDEVMRGIASSKGGEGR